MAEIVKSFQNRPLILSTPSGRVSTRNYNFRRQHLVHPFNPETVPQLSHLLTPCLLTTQWLASFRIPIRDHFLVFEKKWKIFPNTRVTYDRIPPNPKYSNSYFSPQISSRSTFDYFTVWRWKLHSLWKDAGATGWVGLMKTSVLSSGYYKSPYIVIIKRSHVTLSFRWQSHAVARRSWSWCLRPNNGWPLSHGAVGELDSLWIRQRISSRFEKGGLVDLYYTTVVQGFMAECDLMCDMCRKTFTIPCMLTLPKVKRHSSFRSSMSTNPSWPCALDLKSWKEEMDSH